MKENAWNHHLDYKYKLRKPTWNPKNGGECEMNILFKQVIFKFHASFRGVIIHKPELVGHVFFGKCLSLLKIVVPMVYFFSSFVPMVIHIYKRSHFNGFVEMNPFLVYDSNRVLFLIHQPEVWQVWKDCTYRFRQQDILCVTRFLSCSLTHMDSKWAHTVILARSGVQV